MSRDSSVQVTIISVITLVSGIMAIIANSLAIISRIGLPQFSIGRVSYSVQPIPKLIVPSFEFAGIEASNLTFALLVYGLMAGASLIAIDKLPSLLSSGFFWLLSVAFFHWVMSFHNELPWLAFISIALSNMAGSITIVFLLCRYGMIVLLLTIFLLPINALALIGFGVFNTLWAWIGSVAITAMSYLVVLFTCDNMQASRRHR